MRKIFFILYIGMICILLSGCGADTAMKKGDKYYALGEYYDAATQYKKAYSQTPAKERQLRGLRALKMADCYRRINHTQRAIAAYKNAIRFKQKDSLTLFHLGRLQLKNGSYKDAENTFLEMIEEGNRSQLVKNGLQSARMAPQWKAEAEYSGYTVKREDIFNSRRTDYSPMLAGDDYNQLYFSSTRNQAKGDELSGITGMKNADIFVSQKDEKGKWQKPEAIESDLNSDFDEGACAFTPDFKTMYLTVCKTDPNYPRFAKIATATRSDASWGKATDLEITKDTLSAFAHPTISPDGEWLYFVSDMPGGLGGYDIWRIQITGRGLVGLENLGAPINTEGNELFPSFRPNGDLYFSSDGHPGMGGLDIFIAKPITEERQDDSSGQTSELYTIEHPGVPLNSAGDDFGMTFEGLHNRGFFSSNRGNANGWDHIYSFEKSEVIQTVKGWVYEKDGYELPQALVYMVGNDGTNKKLNVKGDGSFTEEIQPGVDYVFLGTCKGFLNHKEELRVEPVKESEEYVLQFPLASLSAPVLIRNIFYDFDKATLRPESTQALDSLITLLNENPNITIELSSHTDFRGADAYNQRLSQRRAESVVNYLIDHGIAQDRLSPVGYGEEKPKVVKRKLTETYPWLKEGDVLTEEFISALKDEEKQEICHQLNRRTEFIVLRTTYGLGATNH
ncbi:OmpA family protein [Xylanibacter brevis]|uniref:PorE family type IX secretion system protein n=1 Tax=Xylanibacter brevis TaxID=83231 RepID=UPI0005C6C44C|nr:OmpA family protein [Xylanibacter brevis]